MKKVLSTLFGSLALSVLMISCAPSKEDAIKYNDALVEQQTKVIKAEDALIQAISHNATESMDEALNTLVKQIASSEEAVNKMDDFDGKSDYKDAALSLFKAYKNAAEKEYPEVIKIAKTPNDQYTQDMDDQLMTLSRTVDEKLNKEIEAFVAKQKEFAEKYKFDLTAGR